MTDDRAPRAPLWLRLLGGSVLALMALAMAFAIATAVYRFPEIGV